MHFVCVYSKQLTDPLAETVQVDHYDQQMFTFTFTGLVAIKYGKSSATKANIGWSSKSHALLWYHRDNWWTCRSVFTELLIPCSTCHVHNTFSYGERHQQVRSNNTITIHYMHRPHMTKWSSKIQWFWTNWTGSYPSEKINISHVLD